MARQYFACLDIEGICIDIYNRILAYAIPSSAYPPIPSNYSPGCVVFVACLRICCMGLSFMRAKSCLGYNGECGSMSVGPQ